MKNSMIKIDCAYIKISGIATPSGGHQHGGKSLNYVVGIANPPISIACQTKNINC